MVTLEDTGDLLVLHYLGPPAEGDEAAYLAGLETAGARRHGFALVIVTDGVGKLSEPSERSQALWFKRTRADMNLHCRGVVVVRAGFDEAKAEVFRRLWTFPIRIAADAAEARTLARTLL